MSHVQFNIYSVPKLLRMTPTIFPSIHRDLCGRLSFLVDPTLLFIDVSILPITKLEFTSLKMLPVQFNICSVPKLLRMTPTIFASVHRDLCGRLSFFVDPPHLFIEVSILPCPLKSED